MYESNISKQWLGIAAGILVAIVFIIWLIQYLLVGQYFIGTDDAYLAAAISPKWQCCRTSR